MNMTREELLSWAMREVSENGGTLYLDAPGGFSATVSNKIGASGGIVTVELT